MSYITFSLTAKCQEANKTITPQFSLSWVTFAFGRLREGQLLLTWRDGQFEQHDPAIEKIWDGEAVGKKMTQSFELEQDVSHHAARQVSGASEKPGNPVCLGGKYNQLIVLCLCEQQWKRALSDVHGVRFLILQLISTA